ncbi:MAG: cytochrome C oxidase subunit IV family protein [Myxococcaceae bacterium]|nr:cytochrome C oxidase subunit IV family protein [Myxococcaceae bacterium]
MADTAHAAAPAPGAAPAGHHHGPSYVKIWAILLGLLVVSVAGPFLGIRVVTLITAFGIALVKAYIVAKYFMHINLERKFVTYLLVTMIVLMGLMVGAVSPDVMKHDGARWENVAAKKAVERGEAAAAAGEGHHAEGGEAAPHAAPAEH